MALADNRTQRIITFCALYVAQGVPWGFMLITLPAYLAFRYGVGDDQIGQLTAIILIPWSFKLIWAPIMDSFTIRSMGRRRPWIIGAEVMMAASLLGFVGLGDPSGKLGLILAMYFVHNCFASLQDVCTDALAVDILPTNEHGRMNGMMWGSKLIGKGIGAWTLSHVLNYGGIEACVAVQVALLLAIVLIPLLTLERAGEKMFPWSEGAAKDDGSASVGNPLLVFKSWVKAFSLTTTFIYLLFTVAKLIGPGINEVVTKTLYTQQLNPKWTDQLLSRVNGLEAMPLIILGAIGGGYLADKFGRRMILLVGFGGYGLLAILYAAFPQMWNETWYSRSYILGYEALNAIASVGFLSLAMRISWTTAAATVFTTYLTLSNVGHVIGNYLAGPVRRMLTFDRYGDSANMVSYEYTFWFVGVITILPLLFLPWVKPKHVDQANRRLSPVDPAPESV